MFRELLGLLRRLWMSRSASPSLLMMLFRWVNLPMCRRSSFSPWTGHLLEVFSAITSVLLLLMIRPTCFANWDSLGNSDSSNDLQLQLWSSSSDTGLLRTFLKCSTHCTYWPFTKERKCSRLSHMGTFILHCSTILPTDQ